MNEGAGRMTPEKKAMIKDSVIDIDLVEDGASLADAIKSLKSILGYKFVISDLNLKWFADTDSKTKKQKLGQVFTPPHIARLIADLCIPSPDSRILDPCFGEGVFLNTAFDRITQLGGEGRNNIFGVELDPALFVKGLSTFLDKSGISGDVPPNFFNGSIFDFEGGPFDAIIFNPPYVRQEDLMSGSQEFLNKVRLSLKASTNGEKLSGRSNLYSYFVVYLDGLLKAGGRMGMITSNSWLDAHFGRDLQDFLTKGFTLEYIIDFSEDSFRDADVEDCIVVVRKRDGNVIENESTRFVHIKKFSDPRELAGLMKSESDVDNDHVRVIHVDRTTLLNDRKWRKFLYVPKGFLNIGKKKLTALSNVARVERGWTTGRNEFFDLDEEKIRKYSVPLEKIKPIINSPKDLRSFSVKDAHVSKILFIDRPLDKDDGDIVKYIEDWARSNLSERSRIVNDWYIAKQLKSGSIIFGYIIRKTKAFILNDPKIPVRDNFYCISPEYSDSLLLFGLLNSTFCKAMLELSGRRYGRGLLKVQAYELEDMPIPDPRWMPHHIKETIRERARALADDKLNERSSEDIIRAIDLAVCEYLDTGLTPEQLRDMESELVRARLGKVNSVARGS